MKSGGADSPRYVAVSGPAEAGAREIELAHEVGALLGRRGAVVLCGGLGGVMEACAEGATAAGGTVVGLLPGLDRTLGNRHLTVALPTGLGELRNGLLVNACDALIAVGGSWGTLSEVALALRAGKRVAALATWGVPREALSAPGTTLPAEVATPAEAVTHALMR
ncbi:TIGR00725 family protein [Streptomyces sp. NPDC054842]